MNDKGNGKSSKTTAVNVRMIEEEMAHLYEHLLVLNPLVNLRYAAYKATLHEYLRVRDRYEALDRSRANLSKSTTIHISGDAVRARMRKQVAATLDAKIRALGKEELADLISQLEERLK